MKHQRLLIASSSLGHPHPLCDYQLQVHALSTAQKRGETQKKVPRKEEDTAKKRQTRKEVSAAPCHWKSMRYKRSLGPYTLWSLRNKTSCHVDYFSQHNHFTA